jgi:alpha-beta hydrolase superfamily lysophospholipase
VILLCHGIGETVEHWSAVQALLHELGVGSMVFNYSGYGRSSGVVRAEHCDEDFVAAYAELRRRVGPETRVFVLGFSLGSGIAASGVRELTPRPAGLIVCEAYTSFREAVCELGFPRWVALGFPDVWNTVAAAPLAGVPVLVVHSDADRLFPVAMARRIADACGERGELLVVNGWGHAEPYKRPTDKYWGPIAAWVRANQVS